MYFPSDMNFQYFFFDTYPGYFLQAFPFALLVGIIFILRKKQPFRKSVVPALFVCYLTVLVCVTLLIELLSDAYYFLFYHMPSGNELQWFRFEFDWIPDFFRGFGAENLGNILLFFPFGLLYPLFYPRATWKRTVLFGVGVSVGIELLQPIFGRRFDVNDLILNSLGVLASATIFFAARALFRRKH